MYRLIALDVDGTLLDSSHHLAPADRDAVIEAQRRGARVCLATGKLLSSVKSLIETLKLTGLQITCNGAALMDATTGEAAQSWPLDPPTRAAALKAIRDIAPDQPIAWYTTNAIYTDAEPGRLDAILASYHEPPVRHVARLDDSLPPPLKFLMTGDPERLAPLHEQLTASLGERASVMRTTADFVEIVAPHVSKGVALSALARNLGIAREDIVAIGDGENDIPLLQDAGLGIAMANAMPALKRHAQALTGSADAHGVAHALAALGLATGDASARLRWL